MPRCPICGAELKPEELLPPFCGAVCKKCDGLSEDEVDELYPIWYIDREGKN